jgi:hypothetical protein
MSSGTPTSYALPWSLDMVSTVPKGVFEAQQANYHSYCVGASQGRWNCFGTQHVYDQNEVHYTFFLWYAPPSYSQEDVKHKAPFLKLSHWRLEHKLDGGVDDMPPPPLLALQVSPQTPETVYLYAANPTTGALVLWMINRDDLLRPVAPPNSCLTQVPINDDYNDDIEEDESSLSARDQLSCLTASYPSRTDTPIVLLGTLHGSVFWVKQTHLPIAMHVQRVSPSQTAGGSGFGILTRILGSGGVTSHAREFAEGSPIVANLVLEPAATGADWTTSGAKDPSPKSKKSFLSITERGRIVAWTVTPTESHRSFFASKEVMQLANALQEKNQDVYFTTLQVLCGTWNWQTQQLHVLFYAFVAAGEDNDSSNSRLYWARLDLVPNTTQMMVQHMVWLNRFADPHNDVLVAGLVATDNGMAYAVLTVEPDQNNTLYPTHYIQLGNPHQSTSHSTVIMALDTISGAVHEEDVIIPRSVTTVLPGTISKDMATHGISFWDTSGMMIRMRFSIGASREVPASKTNPLAIHKLTQHLQAVFWDWYRHPDRTIRLPPSMTTADAADLEQAIVSFAKELQGKGNFVSKVNSLEWHLALVDLLQQTSIYRSLSAICRWKLLAIGQELFVFWTFCGLTAETQGDNERWAKLNPCSMAEWLEGLQASILSGGDEVQQAAFLGWLCVVLNAAFAYREEHANATYDVAVNALPNVASAGAVPIWTNHPSIRTVCDRQLDKWDKYPSNAGEDAMKTLVRFMLESCKDRFAACPNEETRDSYATVQAGVFKLLRKANGFKMDRFSFELFKAHHYFSGICQIASDHEKRGDPLTFSLEPLFESLSEETDVGSGMQFGLFVLKWHTERAHFGHVLKYGKYCPHDLIVLMNNEAALKPYRWIHAIQRGDYESATTSLVENASSTTSKLPHTLKDVASKRRRLIEKKRELAIAQEELLGENSSNSTLLSPTELLDVLLQRVEAARVPSEKADLCFTGLAISSGFESIEVAGENAVKIWFTAIEADAGIWQKCANETDLTNSSIRDFVFGNTVFGYLLRQTRDVQSETWAPVMFDSPLVEKGVLATLDSSQSGSGSKMHRLLRSIADKHHGTTA